METEYASKELIQELLQTYYARQIRWKAERKLRKMLNMDEIFEIVEILKEQRDKHATRKSNLHCY